MKLRKAKKIYNKIYNKIDKKIENVVNGLFERNSDIHTVSKETIKEEVELSIESTIKNILTRDSIGLNEIIDTAIAVSAAAFTDGYNLAKNQMRESIRPAEQGQRVAAAENFLREA